uniref:Uncharacterized protein n=1 Tax=Photinus pyralis TaxID=7054 RepID=A0A1Y1LKW0_PHOPY
MPIDLSICPCDTSHLADSGTHHGVKTAKAKGTDVTTQSILQSSKYHAIQGSTHEAQVKNIAIDIFATKVLHFGPTYSNTKIYIIVKQLSKAIPTRNLHKQKVQNELQNAVPTPAANPTKFVPTSAGILPLLSASQPKTKPPRIAPQKKIDWDIVGRAAFSQTQSNSAEMEAYGTSSVVKLYS